MGYTKVKAQKCLLKATNQTEPKGFTSIRPPGWFFSRAGDIYTQKTKTKLEILLSYWICNGCICKWVKIVVIIMELIDASVSFSSCQRNLIKTFQIEGMIALITKMTLIFSSDLLNGQK